MTTRPLATAIAFALPFLAATGAQAAIIVNDTFDTAVHPGGSRTTAAGLGIRYYTAIAESGTQTASIVTDNTAGFSGSVLAINGDPAVNASFPVIGLLPGTVSLANVNDTVTLSFAMRFTNTPTSNATAFRFGIHGSNGTAVTADGQTATSDNDLGYYVQVGFGTAPANNNNLYVENGGITPILAGTDRTPATTATTGFAISNAAVHTFSLTATRTSATTIGVSYVMDALTPLTGSFTTLRTSFDEISFSNGFAGAGNTGAQFSIDNVVVDASNVVPEPGAALLGLCGTALLLQRRRR